jgi:hypothetical protein
MPAPAWGYAAGMVSEPHPKPKPAIPTSQPPPASLPPPVAVPAQTKGKGKLTKKQTEQAPSSANVSQFNLNAQRNWQPYQQQQPQYASQSGYGTRGHITQPQQEEEDDEEDEETEDEEEEDDEENGDEEEEEEETEEDGYPTRYAAHTRQYSQPLAGERQSRGRYEYTTEEEETPKKKPTSSSKKVLRPKAKPTTTQYTDSRPRKIKSADEGYVLVKQKEPSAKAKANV